MLKQLAASLWIYDEPLSMFGIQFGNRTTVVKLSDGRLLLHSPGKLTPELKTALDELGTVTCIVAPNRFHSLFLEQYVSQYPLIKIFMAPGLHKKRADVPCAGLLGDKPEELWDHTLKQHLIKGIPAFNEVVFFHPDSRTLIVTDLTLNILNPQGLMTNVHLFVHGAHKRFAASRIVKMMIKDKAAFEESVAMIMSWDFDRVIMNHGEVVPGGGKEMMQGVFGV